jgi:hypothetical protein
MKNQITPEELVSYHYGEMDYLQKALVNKELQLNSSFNVEYSIIKDSLKALDQIELDPSKETLKNIYNYSKSKNLEPNNHSGY